MAMHETRTYLLRTARENEFDCMLCQRKILGRESMVEHLENYTCTPAGKEGTLVEIKRHMMIQNVKWRIVFLEWHHFRGLIRDNKLDEFRETYHEDTCRGCMTLAEHRAGGCETRPKRGLIIEHLAKKTYEHYYAWAGADHEIDDMALNKEHDEKIEATTFSDLIYMADELWPQMREAQQVLEKKFKDRVEKFRKEIANIFDAEQLLFERLDSGMQMQQFPPIFDLLQARLAQDAAMGRQQRGLGLQAAGPAPAEPAPQPMDGREI